MSVRVISPPVPAVTPAEARVLAGLTGTDEIVEALIAAAQGSIDGPDGWLGRAIGKQTLEVAPGWPMPLYSGGIALPCPPLVSIVSITYGASLTLDPAAYALGLDAVLRSVSSWPWGWGGWPGVKFRYVAGYVGQDGSQATPAPIKEAISLMAKHKQLRAPRDPSLITDTVFGVGSQQFSAEPSTALMDDAKKLLEPYWVRTL